MTSLVQWFNESSEYEIDGKKLAIKIVGTSEKPWFKARDVCNALGYTSAKDALHRHVKPQYKTDYNTIFSGFADAANPLFRRDREGQQPYITEAGLYGLIFASKLPTADAFRTWVFEEVLPSIRKDGQYRLSQTLEAKSVELSNALKAIEDEKATGVQTRAMLEKERKAKEDAIAAERKAKEDAIAEEKRAAENLERQKAATESERLAKEDALAYALILKEMVIPTNKRTFDEVIYISTSRAYATQNRFKVGGVEHVDKLKSRFATYNGRSAAGDEWYFSDIFKVASFKACEKRIEDVLGRFRDKKEKEMYVMHYVDLSRYLDFICEHYENELETFNEELNDLIANLNRRHLEPTIPKPYEGTTAIITRIVKGVPTNTRIESSVEELFKQRIRLYLDSLPSSTEELKRVELFERIPFQFNRNEGWKWLKQVVSSYKPDLTVKYR
jgi:prophage antirepressor-like protein